MPGLIKGAHLTEDERTVVKNAGMFGQMDGKELNNNDFLRKGNRFNLQIARERHMSNERLTDETRKRLTEFLGECWHKYVWVIKEDKLSKFGCWECAGCNHATQYHERQKRNRSFTTEADLMALYRAIWKEGKWGEFENYAYQKSYGLGNKSPLPFIAWLLCLDGDYERGCGMVGEFISRY